MVQTTKFFCLFVLIFSSLISTSQNNTQVLLKQYEDSLSLMMNKIYCDGLQSEIEAANQNFLITFQKTIKIKESFDYPFDSLKHLGKIKSEDKRLRVFTWNVPQSDGTQKYFGYILYKQKKSSSYSVFELQDNRKLISDPINEIISSTKWMGALYYSIVEKKDKKNQYYILLGLDFNNLFSSKKIIEVLSFGKDSQPVFGAKIFKVGETDLNRVVFEYSSRASMTLRYIPEASTIVFDHLSPSKPEYTQNYQFYGPDFTYDGFMYEKGAWVYVRNLDMRNPKRGPITLKESPKKEPDPGFLYKGKGGIPMFKNK